MWDFVEPAKKWFGKRKQLPSRRSESKGTALKQFQAERSLKLRNLTTDCRLLDAVRHLSSRRANSAVSGHVIEQLEMMNVHLRIIVLIDV